MATELLEAPTANELQQAKFLVNELRTLPRFLQRGGSFAGLDGPNRDLDAECGYPYVVNVEDIKQLMKRDGIAGRVVRLLAEESWKAKAELYESEKPATTPFEKEWKKLCTYPHNLYTALRRADVRSGIGRFGVLVVGVDDGKQLHRPAKLAVDDYGQPVRNAPSGRRLTFLRSYDETRVKVEQTDLETDWRSPRYGWPKHYQVLAGDAASGSRSWRKVHWSRVIHLCDDPIDGEFYAPPRLEDVFNYVLNLRKLLGSSAEMFWKGGFPLLYFMIDKTLQDPTVDHKKLKDEFAQVMDGLKRFMAGVGMEVKSLSSQIADPSPHLMAQIQAICAAKGVPFRVFLGSEQGELASSQDVKTWNQRLHDRRDNYLTPCVVLPLAWRLVHLGVLPQPASGEILVKWPDPNALGRKERTDIALKLTQAMGEFTTKHVGLMTGVKAWMQQVLELDADVVEALTAGIGDIDTKPPEPKPAAGGTNPKGSKPNTVKKDVPRTRRTKQTAQ